MTAGLNGALKCYETAYREFDRLGDLLQAGEMQRRIGRVYWEQPDRPAALQHYYQAYEILKQAPESVELAWATSSISQLHMLGFEPEDAISWCERALAMAERLGAEDVIVDTLNNLGSTYSQIGNRR